MAYPSGVTCASISIHAPAWGATNSRLLRLLFPSISIHAPAWGATGCKAMFCPAARYFNPRSRVGSDTFVPPAKTSILISIHAPAWGATDYFNVTTDYLLGFQSTLPRGERRCLPRSIRRYSIFQSTLPRGERLKGNFFSVVFGFISIHAPAWGATSVPSAYVRNKHISIHAPAWGATCNFHLLEAVLIYFNPRSRVGSDLSLPCVFRRRPSISIHAPAWGATSSVSMP